MPDFIFVKNALTVGHFEADIVETKRVFDCSNCKHIVALHSVTMRWHDRGENVNHVFCTDCARCISAVFAKSFKFEFGKTHFFF